jgi:hypothetical protein
MKVTNKTPKLPFTEQVFNVEMTGFELAIFKAFVANTSGTGDMRDAITKISKSIPVECLSVYPVFKNDIAFTVNTDQFKDKVNKMND